MKLPILSGKEVVKALKRADFIIIRQTGSHIVMTKNTSEGKRTVIVPQHSELAKGTFLSIISQSGLNREEFVRLLK